MFTGEIEHFFGGGVEPLDLGYRAGVTLVAMQDGLDVQRRAQRRAEEADALVTTLLDPVAQVMQIRRHHVALNIAGQAFQVSTNLGRCFTRCTHACGLNHQHADRRKYVLTINHTQCKRGGVAACCAHRFVIVEDGVTGLHRVVVNTAARAGGGDAKHVIVVMHQFTQEQVVYLLHGVGRSFGLECAFGGFAGEKAHGGFLIAGIG